MYAHFNPRPREEGDVEKCDMRTVHSNFNPRPREEGDLGLPYTSSLPFISIHALVKRATNGKIYGDSYKYISIHALVKRATYD